MARRLPPLTALRAFEAAARHSSFSLAADELNVTQGAVSRQVKILENFLKTPLFYRGPRGVWLTEAGVRYLSTASSIFDQLEIMVSAESYNKKPLFVNLLPSCAILWFTKKITLFNELYPSIQLQISTSQHPINFWSENVDAALRVGMLPDSEDVHNTDEFIAKGMATSWNGLKTLHLWKERIIPVCSNEFLASNPQLEHKENLETVTLIHNTSRPRCWEIWLKANGLEPLQRRDQDLYLGQRFMAVFAALEGRGVACVPTSDTSTSYNNDRIITLYDTPVETGSSYYLLYREDTLHYDQIRTFADFLLQNMKPQT